jgi:hypothetical protein
VKETVTYVEMTALSQLIPAAPVPGLTLEPVDRGSRFIPGILARLGAALRRSKNTSWHRPELPPRR